MVAASIEIIFMLASSKLAKLYFAAILNAIRSDASIYGLLLIYLACGTAYVLIKGGMLFGALDVYLHTCLLTYCVILPFAVLIAGIARIMHRLNQRRSVAYRAMFGPRRVARFIAGTLLMVLVLAPFEAMFASIKSAFSEGNFGYDKPIADLDKLIHFGHAPVRYMLSVAQNEWVLRAIEFNYDVLWFVLCFGILYWVAISPRADAFRLRYCGTFFAVWVIVGNVIAGLFPTAGPAFYSLVTGDAARFAKLRAFLENTTGSFSSAADTQHYLWSLHQAGLSGFGSGISAFPSMHVALVTMNALFIAEHSRRLGLAAAAYVCLIIVSSVFLGWHYALDGYVAVILTCGIYFACTRATRITQWLRDWKMAATLTAPSAGQEVPAK
jgi:hypothetical protein